MLAALTLTLLMHSSPQLAAWEQDWSARAETMGFVLTADLVDEWQDMQSRHPAPRVVMLPPQPRTVRPVAAGVEQWRGLVAVYFPAEQVDHALRVMACESGGNPWADNPRSTASGLFQHLASYWEGRSVKAGWAGASIWDPEANIAVAAWLSKGGSDWSDWNASRHCWG